MILLISLVTFLFSFLAFTLGAIWGAVSVVLNIGLSGMVISLAALVACAVIALYEVIMK